jgi:riboflavin kinase / FMN adenylyltransferase
MRIITEFTELPINQETAITIGNFDGVHLGHQELIKTTRKRAKENKLLATVVTFDIHPHQYFNPESNHIQIVDIDTKLKLLAKYGIELCVILPFQMIHKLNSRQFVEDILISRLNMRYLIEGSDFRFGKDNSTDTNELREISKEKHFGLDIVERQSQSGLEASSTFIRKCIASGEYRLAEKILGHPHKNILSNLATH